MPFHIKYSPRLLIGILIAVFFGVALFIRIYYPYDKVFVDEWIKFTNNDAYYQMRIVDSAAYNFPQYTQFDPYLIYPGGANYGDINFFNWLLALVIWIGTLGSPTAHAIDMIGVYFPAVLAALTIIPVYFIGKALFNRWAGVIAAGMMAVLPGEFMGRTILGGMDKPVAEVLFTTIAAMFVIYALKAGRQKQLSWSHIAKRDWKALTKPLIYSLLGGLFLGLYLITWAGGLLFVFIFALYLLIQFIIDHFKGQSSFYLGFTGFFVFVAAFVVFQPVAGGSFHTAALIIAMIFPPVLAFISRLIRQRGLKAFYYPAALVVIAAVFFLVFYFVKPDLLRTMVSQFSIFIPAGSTGATTIEMKPFLSPAGKFTTAVAWGNFTTSFFLAPWNIPIPGIAFISLIVLIVLYIKKHSDDKPLLFLFIWTLIILVLTLTTRRYAYYLAINIAVLSAYLSWKVAWLALNWKRNPGAPETLREQYSRTRYIGVTGGIIAFGTSFFLTGTQYFFIPVFILGLLSIFYGFRAWVRLKGKNEYMILWAFVFPIGILVLAFSEDESVRDKSKKKTQEPANPWLYRFSTVTLAIIIFMTVFWPNYDRSRSVAREATYVISDGWAQTMDWLKENTPEPLPPDSYYALYESSIAYPNTAYGITAWWDYGWWITRIAQRMPSANPSQWVEPTRKVADLFLSRDAEQAGDIMEELGSSYIVLDNTMTTTKLWAVAHWAGDSTEYMSVFYWPRQQDEIVPIQVYTTDYYKLLSVRLFNFDGKASTGEKPLVLVYENRTDRLGNKYNVLTEDPKQFDSYQSAVSYANSRPEDNIFIAGSDPFTNPIPIEAVTDFNIIYSSEYTVTARENNVTPEVKVFEYLGN